MVEPVVNNHTYMFYMSELENRVKPTFKGSCKFSVEAGELICNKL